MNNLPILLSIAFLSVLSMTISPVTVIAAENSPSPSITTIDQNGNNILHLIALGKKNFDDIRNMEHTTLQRLLTQQNNTKQLPTDVNSVGFCLRTRDNTFNSLITNAAKENAPISFFDLLKTILRLETFLIHTNNYYITSTKGNYNTSPLHFCSTPEQVIYFIKEWGCDVNAMDSNRDTPLNCALRKKNYDVAVALLANGANPQIANIRLRNTVFSMKIYHNSLPIGTLDAPDKHVTLRQLINLTPDKIQQNGSD